MPSVCHIRRINQTVILGFVILILLVSRPVKAAIYAGLPQNGSSSGGAWYYVHTATSHSVTPSGGWTQFAGGTVLTAIDPTTPLTFTFNDFGNDGLGDNDTLVFNTQLVIRDFSGNIFGTPTLLGPVGTIDISGTLTVGGNHAPEYTHGLSGSLDFLVEYTADGLGNRKAGDAIEGTWYFQAANITSKFNGIRDDIEFAIWGDDRNATGANPDGTLFKADESVVNNYGLGVDFVVTATVVPEPSSLVVWSILGTIACGWTWRRRKRAA